MKRGTLFLGIIITMMLLISCSNNAEDNKGNVKDTDSNVKKDSIEIDNNDNKQEIENTHHLSQPEIVALLEEKEYLLKRFKIPYDEYRKIYIKYFENALEIDEKYLYMHIISDEFERVPMVDFIGKDVKETREYLESVGYPLKSHDSLLEERQLMYEVMISDVYNDNYNDWTYVFVQKAIQSNTILLYGTLKYTFEKVDDDYKIIMYKECFSCLFTDKDLKSLTQEEIDSRINTQPYKYINNELVKYTNIIDMKEVINKY